jgi:hypothetical protein
MDFHRPRQLSFLPIANGVGLNVLTKFGIREWSTLMSVDRRVVLSAVRRLPSAQIAEATWIVRCREGPKNEVRPKHAWDSVTRRRHCWSKHRERSSGVSRRRCLKSSSTEGPAGESLFCLQPGRFLARRKQCCRPRIAVWRGKACGRTHHLAGNSTSNEGMAKIDLSCADLFNIL